MRKTGREGGLRLAKVGSDVNPRGILNLFLGFISTFWSVSSPRTPITPPEIVISDLGRGEVFSEK